MMTKPAWMYRSAADRNRARIELMAIQRGRCAGCLTTGELVVDHDHATGYVRGLLCVGCNVREHRMGDDWQDYIAHPPAILSAAECLARFRRRAERNAEALEAQAATFWPDAIEDAVSRSVRLELKDSRDHEWVISSRAQEAYGESKELIGRLVASVKVTVSCDEPEILEAFGMTLPELQQSCDRTRLDLEDKVYMGFRRAFAREIGEEIGQKLRAASVGLAPHEWVWESNEDPKCAVEGCSFKYYGHPSGWNEFSANLRAAREALADLRSSEAA